jgi:hypothetical protein
VFWDLLSFFRAPFPSIYSIVCGCGGALLGMVAWVVTWWCGGLPDLIVTFSFVFFTFRYQTLLTLF